VKFINHLSNEDMLRSTKIPETASLLAGAWLCLIEGCDLFATETVNPLIQLWKGMNQRETAFAGLYYRILGFCKTVMLLKAIVHQQSITSAERSVLELYVDMELLHGAAVEHAVDKIITHIDVQKLKAARRVVQFYADNPDLDAKPSYSLPHQDFIAKWADLTMQKAEILWGKDKKGKTILPDHWSGLNLPGRAERIDKALQDRGAQGYDMRNFAVHTGLSGVVNFEKAHLEMQCALSLKDIGECAAAAIKIIGQEFHLYKGMPDFFERLDAVGESPVFAIADKKLQSVGEPARFMIQKDADA
jgi:hypothetical protein